MNGFDPDDTIIVITSDEPWGSVMHTQLHFAYQLSKQYDVIYINPPRVWNPASGFVNFRRTFRVNSKLIVVPYRHLFPLRYFRKLFTFVNDILTSIAIRNYIPVGKSELILWRFDHFRFFSAWLPGPYRTIYYAVDDYVGKPGDEQFAKESELVVVVSPRLQQHYKGLSKNVRLIPQCIPEEDQIVNWDEVNRIGEKYGKYLLFIGTFTSEVSVELLSELARKYSNLNLLIVGPVVRHSFDELERLKDFQSLSNVHFVGSIPGLQLKNYVKGASVCLVPYKFQDDRKVHIRSPLKILNYISQMRPVVTSMESELPDQKKMGIYLVNTPAEFIETVGKLIDQPPVIDQEYIMSYLSQSGYARRIDEVLTALMDIRNQQSPRQ
jgi:hypothetical protein